MLFTFDSFGDFIAPEGCFEWSHLLFGVEPSYDNRLMEVNRQFADTVLRRIRKLEMIEHGLCIPTLVRLYTGLLDELAPPGTPAEVIYSTFIMGRMIERADQAANQPQEKRQVETWTTHPN